MTIRYRTLPPGHTGRCRLPMRDYSVRTWLGRSSYYRGSPQSWHSRAANETP